MKVIFTYWFGDVALDTESKAASSPSTGGSLKPLAATLWNLVKPRDVSIETPIGRVSGNDLNTIGQLFDETQPPTP